MAGSTGRGLPRVPGGSRSLEQGLDFQCQHQRFVCHDLGEISETAVHDSFDTPTRPIGWKGSCKTGQMAE